MQQVATSTKQMNNAHQPSANPHDVMRVAMCGYKRSAMSLQHRQQRIKLFNGDTFSFALVGLRR